MTNMNQTSLHWRDLKSLKGNLFSVLKFIITISLIDFIVSISLPIGLSDEFLLKQYLNDNYEEVVKKITLKESLLSLNQASGWVNTPNYTKGNWESDSMGARISPPSEKPFYNGKSVLLLGSSTINGGSGLTGKNVIAAFMQEKGYKVWNFGTMLYSIDQSIADYHARLSHLNADIIIVGIHNNYLATSNLFIPLRSRGEYNIPLLKPIYISKEGVLEKIDIDIEQQGNVSKLASNLDHLKQYDSSFHKFEQYKYFGIMPITSRILELFNRIKSRLQGSEIYQAELKLQKKLLNDFVNIAKANRSKVIFLKFSEKSGKLGKIIKKINGDYDEMQLDMLNESGFNIISVTQLKNEVGDSINGYYSRDNIHFLREGNKIMAEAIVEKIKDIEYD